MDEISSGSHTTFLNMTDKFPEITIARLFHTVSFSEKDTRISAKTMQMSTKYLEMFTREAIVRCNDERVNESRETSDRYRVKLEGEEVAPSSEVIEQNELDSRHLEKVAGLLVLDF